MNFRCLLTLTAVFLAACAVHSQSGSSGQQVPGPEPNRIYVDEACRIHEVPPQANGGKSRVYMDRGICDVGPDQISTREETDYVNNKRKERTVVIREHTFSLHNPTKEETTFVVEQKTYKHWEIDSDPQPHEIEDGVAVFLVKAGPGQTVELHVGERNPPRR